MAIEIKDTEGIRTISIARPEKANALLASDVVEIREAVVNAPRDCRVLLFRGKGGRHFSAGMDLGTFQDVTESEAERIITSIGEMIRAVRHAPQASVVSIQGACLGAAFELVLAADLRVAHEDVKVGLPEVKLGIPSVVDAAQLHHYVGLSLAKEMLVTGDLKTIAELRETGFANRVVPADEVEAVAHGLARQLSQLPPLAVSEQRRLIDDWLNVSLQTAVDQSVGVFRRMFRSPEVLRAITDYANAPR